MESKTQYIEILLPSQDPFLNYSMNESKSLSELSLINIFIGKNNCGKSRFVRSIFSIPIDNFLYKTNKYDKKFFSFLEELNIKFKKAFSPNVSSIKLNGYSNDYIENILQAQRKDFFCSINPIHEVIKATLSELNKSKEILDNQELDPIGFSYIDSGPDCVQYSDTPKDVDMTIASVREVVVEFSKIFDDMMSAFEYQDIDLTLGNEKRFYIPVLRGMRPLLFDDQYKNLDNQYTNLYAQRTVNDYFDKDSLSNNMKIFTGLELYQELKNKLLGEPEDRDLVKDFEKFLSDNFFEYKPVTLIPKEQEPKVVHIKIGNEPQLPIYKLGDGLQNLIVCTFNIFTEKSRCLFFIEEPDMFMHPSMQRSFLEVLSQFDQHQYFITSHSSHFLDMTIDFANISVFHFSKQENKQPQFHIRPSSPRDRQILLDLGVRNSSVFITNATIWIEGITDRLYLKAYMKKYIDELKNSDPEKYSELIKLKEDYHYSFVEYQGANLTHWSFDPDEDDEYKIRAKCICGHAFLIADGDIGSHLKGDRKAVYEEMLGESFYALEVKEIENLIPVEILQKVVKRFKKFQEYGGDINLIKYQEYAKLEISIGEYLDKILTLPTEKPLFVDKNGTLTSYYKGKFCDYAVEIMKDSEWSLTEDLKVICQKIFDHIITQNQNS
jgi:hypothetical protein